MAILKISDEQYLLFTHNTTPPKNGMTSLFWAFHGAFQTKDAAIISLMGIPSFVSYHVIKARIPVMLVEDAGYVEPSPEECEKILHKPDSVGEPVALAEDDG